MDGRLHGYEGYSAAQIAFPVRVMSELGAKLLVVSNACGGMNPNFRTGDVMVVGDHINLTFDNPLVGPHDVNPGVGYPDMSCPYHPRLIDCGICPLRTPGHYRPSRRVCGRQGSQLRDASRVSLLRRIGGDAVGMSTVPEVIVAAQCGLRVLALSVVTNVCSPDRLLSTDGNRVVAVAQSCRAIRAGNREGSHRARGGVYLAMPFSSMCRRRACLEQHARHAGRHEASQRSTQHGPQPEPRQVGLSIGATPPMPPSCTPIEPKFANPHSA